MTSHTFYFVKNLKESDYFKIEDFVISVLKKNKNEIESLIVEKCEVNDDVILKNMDKFNQIKTINGSTLKKQNGLSYWGITIIDKDNINLLKDISDKENIFSLSEMLNIVSIENACVIHAGI